MLVALTADLPGKLLTDFRKKCKLFQKLRPEAVFTRGPRRDISVRCPAATRPARQHLLLMYRSHANTSGGSA
jgi:hypothetical protein